MRLGQKFRPLSLEDVGVCVGHKVLMEVDDTCALIFGDPKEISDLGPKL
jgi:hypothetical protein